MDKEPRIIRHLRIADDFLQSGGTLDKATFIKLLEDKGDDFGINEEIKKRCRNNGKLIEAEKVQYCHRSWTKLRLRIKDEAQLKGNLSDILVLQDSYHRGYSQSIKYVIDGYTLFPLAERTNQRKEDKLIEAIDKIVGGEIQAAFQDSDIDLSALELSYKKNNDDIDATIFKLMHLRDMNVIKFVEYCCESLFPLLDFFESNKVKISSLVGKIYCEIEKLNDRRIYASFIVILNELCMAYKLNLPFVRKNNEEAIKILSGCESDDEWVYFLRKAYYVEAELFRVNEDWVPALVSYQKSLDLILGLPEDGEDDIFEQAEIKNRCSMVLKNLGRYDEAAVGYEDSLVLYNRILALAEDVEYIQSTIANIHYGMFINECERGDFRMAKTHIVEAARRFKGIGDYDAYVDALTRHADCCHHLNEHDESINVLFEAEKFLLTLEYDDFLYVTGLIRVYSEMVNKCLIMEQYDQAQSHYLRLKEFIFSQEPKFTYKIVDELCFYLYWLGVFLNGYGIPKEGKIILEYLLNLILKFGLKEKEHIEYIGKIEKEIKKAENKIQNID